MRNINKILTTKISKEWLVFWVGYYLIVPSILFAIL